MLLSHNFDLSPETFPPLTRAEFAAVFEEGLGSQIACHCRLLDHPHWVVEVLFSATDLLPQQVGNACAQALIAKRQTQRSIETPPVTVLILGGLKQTPATSDSPDALQPGNWGVDVVETRSGETFLASISWEAMIAQKPEDTIFKVQQQL